MMPEKKHISIRVPWHGTGKLTGGIAYNDFGRSAEFRLSMGLVMQ